MALAERRRHLTNQSNPEPEYVIPGLTLQGLFQVAPQISESFYTGRVLDNAGFVGLKPEAHRAALLDHSKLDLVILFGPSACKTANN